MLRFEVIVQRAADLAIAVFAVHESLLPMTVVAIYRKPVSDRHKVIRIEIQRMGVVIGHQSRHEYPIHERLSERGGQIRRVAHFLVKRKSFPWTKPRSG